MEQAATDAPFASAHTKPRLARVRPRDQDRLRAAKIEIIARFRIETDEQAILDEYMKDFDDWLQERFRAEDSTAPARKKGGGK